MLSRTRTRWIFGLSCSLGLVVACSINSQPVPPGFSDSTGGGKEGDAGTNNPTTGADGGAGGGFNDADADVDAGDAGFDAGDASDDGGDAGDAGDGG